MANNWFQFKQFRIQQDACAMKVTTDACLFGAWLTHLLPLSETAAHVLDIGTGTGLLSLMLAQQHQHLNIDAVELDTDAAAQAAMNVESSPFSSKIKVYHADFLAYEPMVQYDFIFCNPPFHQQQLKTTKSTKNIAHHDEGITMEELLPKAINLMKPTGWLALLLPYYRQEEIFELANNYELSTLQICTVKQSNQHPFFRSMFLFSKTKEMQTRFSTINICDDIPNYSNAFNNLLQPYYLNL